MGAHHGVLQFIVYQTVLNFVNMNAHKVSLHCLLFDNYSNQCWPTTHQPTTNQCSSIDIDNTSINSSVWICTLCFEFSLVDSHPNYLREFATISQSHCEKLGKLMCVYIYVYKYICTKKYITWTVTTFKSILYIYIYIVLPVCKMFFYLCPFIKYIYIYIFVQQIHTNTHEQLLVCGTQTSCSQMA